MLGLGACVLAPTMAFAQQARKTWRIGLLQIGSKQFFISSGYQQAFLEGMRERGYVAGTDFVVEERFADGDVGRLSALASDLVRIPVDLILTSGTQANRAVQQSTTTIPVVTVAEADPVGNGLAVSLARPGKNITGLSTQFGDTIIKNVELLAASVPELSRLAVLINPSNQGHKQQLATVRSTAQKTGIHVLPFDAANAAAIEPAIEAAQRQQAQALLILPDSVYSSQVEPIARSSYVLNPYPEAGGLMSYGRDNADYWRLSPSFIDRIFKGARPGDLPFEQPATFQLVLNMKTAQALGVKIPQALLIQAAKVIE
jgi:putative ABC transport system substrate-binding protein